MNPIRTALVLLATGTLAGACGDALVDGAYRGEALYLLEGWVRLDAADASLPLDAAAAATADTGSGPLRVALFWAPAKGSGFALEGAVEQDVATDGLFPARFRLALFAPPDDELVKPVIDGVGDLAVAVVLAYIDNDRDRTWDRDSEPVVGGAPENLIVYTPEGVQSRLYGALGAGFHRLIPIRDCVPRPDGTGFEVRYAIDRSDIDLFVSMNFPVELLVDADCDGSPGEWTGVCPPLDRVRATCRGEPAVAGPNAALCGACEPLLPPEPATRETCDDWFEGCLFSAPPRECEREWRACRGESPTEQHCDELDCVCRHFYDECMVETGGDEGVCQERFRHCMSR